MRIHHKDRLFSYQPRSSVYRMFIWGVLLLATLWMLRGVSTGEVQAVGQPTPTPTRAATSFEAEAEARFTAGDLGGAIEAYRSATKLQPNNADNWARMARIQTYFSALQTTRADTLKYLEDAKASITQAIILAPEDSTVAAIHAYVLDWTAAQYTRTDPELATDLLVEAEQEAVRALQLDNTNTLALIFYAEILLDQNKWEQAEKFLSQARERGMELMDWHRVYAYYLETQAYYSDAIQEYDRAIEIAPNYTYLHLRAGANYRALALRSTITSQQKELYERSLDYFDRAAKVNEQIRIQDPIPYLSIAKTYAQLGEFFSATRNVQKALEFRPNDPDVYGQLGIVYVRSRNYEGSIPAFECALFGCDAAKSCEARYGRECNPKFGEAGVAIQGLGLQPDTLVYYYTYGSVLAALSRPQANYCPRAREVFAEIRASIYYSEDIAPILDENEAICRIVDAKIQGIPVSAPSSTPIPVMMETPQP